MVLPRWLWLPTLAQTLLSLVLCFVPLFDLLAYEYCFAVGLLAAITSPMIGLRASGRAGRPGEALRHALGYATLQLLPGLVLIALNATRVRNCNFVDGISFFVLLPVASAWYGAALGALTARVCLNMSRAVRVAVAVVTVVAPLAASLWALYTQPPIFVFDHLWGYFAGSLYDESIGIDTRLLMFRLGTALRIVAIAAVVVAWERWARLGTSVVLSAVLLAMGSVIAYESLLGPKLGFRVNRDTIQARLPVRVERPHLVIHLPPGTDAATQAAVADDHAFRLSALLTRLDVIPSEPIHSYVYANATQKALLMGGRNTMVAKPWLHEIHVHDVEVPHRVVPHELAHAVAADFGSDWLQVSAKHELFVNMGLVEGFAQAFTPDTDELDLHHWARAMRDLKLAPDMRDILGPTGFWAQAPRRAYTVAGSFVRYLLEKEGAGPLKAAYATGDFARAYQRDLGELVTHWERFLDTVKVTPREQHVAAERFRVPSIFAKTCAHEIAQLVSEAERADPAAAVDLRRRVCSHLGNSPSSRIELAQAMRRAGDLDGFLSLAKDLLGSKELNPVQLAELQEARSEVLWEQGRAEEARQAARAVLQLEISQAAERLAWVRLWAMDLRPEVGDPLLRFLVGKMSPVAAVLLLDREGRANPGDKTYPYLIARQLHRAEAWDQALAALHEASPHPFPPMEAERQRLLAETYWRLGRLEAAANAWSTYQDHALTSGEAAVGADWQARLTWLKANKK